MFSNIHAVLWLLLTVVFIVVELETYQLVAAWFALGSASAMVTAFAGWLAFQGQLTVFLVVSILTLAALRPFIKRVLKLRPVATNSDQLIGKTGRVIEAIDPMKKGRVHISGLDWSAAAAEPIEPGRDVEVLAIEGVTLVVREK